MTDMPTHEALLRKVQELESAAREHQRIEKTLKESNERFRSLVETTSDWIWEVNQKGVYTYSNRKVRDILGYDPEEIVGKTPFDLIAPGQVEKTRKTFSDLANAKNEIVKLENACIHKNGQIVLLETSGVPIFDKNGNLLGYRGIDRDITDRKKMEHALKASEEKLRENEERMQLALKSANLGLFDYNIQKNTLLVDDGWLEMLGYSPDEIKIDTETCWSWIHPEDRPKQQKALQDHVAGRSPYYHLDEYRVRSKSGEWVWLLGHGKIVECDACGKPLRLVGIHLDITGRKQAEEEIRQLNQKLEQRVLHRTAQLEAANKELEAFAYSVSHDLRAPLRHIDGFLELLQRNAETALDEKSRHYMDTISAAVKKMELLIGNLLSFSRMGHHAVTIQQVDLDMLVGEILREFEMDTSGRNIDWRINDLPLVSGDEAMLRTVLVNLISNALKFTRSRQQARIEIGKLPDQEFETVIFVRDNGVGFDMAYADKLFCVFQRLHSAEEFEGTGIGLANVRRIIARHGGRTWAEGTIDHGATFYFSLSQLFQEV